MEKSVLLDTSFFIRFLKVDDPLYQNADDYFRYFLENNINMLVSTISIAEFCIGGSIDELPLKNIQIVPFNVNHARRAGEFARVAFQHKHKGDLIVKERLIIPNDTKLFAQADCIETVEFYLSSDLESLKVYNSFKNELIPNFQFVDLNVPLKEFLGLLF